MGSKPNSRKRKGPKSTRGGCLMCKPWKRQGTKLADRQKKIGQYLSSLGDEDMGWLMLAELSLADAWGDEDDDLIGGDE